MDFLRDTTGNRRFWPVDIDVAPRKKTVWSLTDEEIRQLWAEAKARWVMGEKLYLTEEEEKLATAVQEAHREISPKEGPIARFVEEEIPVDWQKWNIDRRRDWRAGATQGEVQTAPRDRVAAIEIWCELYNGNQKDFRQTDAREINNILAKMPGLVRAKSTIQCGPYGAQRGFYIQNTCPKTPV